MTPLTHEQAIKEAGRKAGAHNISAVEQNEIARLLRTIPLPQVKHQTGRSYSTLIKIAEAVLP